MTEADERRQANRELGRAKRTIDAIRNFYITNLVWCALIFGALFLVRAPRSWLLIAFAVTAFMAVGVAQIRSRPYIWSLMIAVIWVVLMGAWALSGTLRLNVWSFLGGAWVIGCWWMVPRTKQVEDLLDKYPDLWIAKKMGSRSRQLDRKRRR